ncbi:hypothetical protein E4U54_005026, partial [Claviceps lovelessii]
MTPTKTTISSASSTSSSSSSSCSLGARLCPLKPATPSPPARLIDETSRYLSFFDLFAKSNSFTGRGRTTGDEVKQLKELHSRKGNHVLHAMLAVGGMFAGRRNLVGAPARRETGLVALQYYSYSIAGLREALDRLEIQSGTRRQQNVQDEHICILWTTLLLGLFEARIFEISRTILYNERTFLSEPGWAALSRGLSLNGGGGG